MNSINLHNENWIKLDKRKTIKSKNKTWKYWSRKKIKKIRRILEENLRKKVYVTPGTRKCSHPLGLRENLTVRSRGCRKRVKLERQSNTLPPSMSLGCQRLRHGNKSHAATPMAGRLRAANKKEGRRDVVS